MANVDDGKLVARRPSCNFGDPADGRGKFAVLWFPPRTFGRAIDDGELTTLMSGHHGGIVGVAAILHEKAEKGDSLGIDASSYASACESASSIKVILTLDPRFHLTARGGGLHKL
jgi:hypothetical protein